MHGRSRKLSIAILHVTLVASMTVVAFTATPAQADPPAATSLPRLTGSEAEPNGTSATATPLTGTDRVRGNINPVGDVDFYSFTATAGTRVYSAVMTSGSQSGNNDSILALIGQDGTTVIEDDDNNGVFGSSASSIAGSTIPSNGTYYLRVTTAAQQLRPYDLYLQTRSGSPAAETEPNEAASPQTMPPSNWVNGSTSAASDVDAYNISLNAGDTVYVSLDMDPERNGEWNGRLNFGTFSGTLLTTNDAGSTGYDSEAFFTTVKSSGTYRVQVEAITTFGTYNLSTTVISPESPTCQSFSSSGAQAIPDGSSSSSINVPDDFRLGRVAMDIDLDHANMPDLDIALQTPAGNEIVLVTDVGGSTVTDMDVRLDDHAALPPALFTAHTNQMLQPKNTARLAWTEGESSTGTWTLNLKDDVANALTGTLNSWQLILCEEPAPSGGASVYSSNFESDDGGFTHSGTADEWELGLPTAEPITTCNTGTSCWKTDLDSAYDASSSQDLVSPPISLAGLTGPLKVSWAQRYQMDTANNDHFYVEVREVGGANPRTLFEWDGAVMTQLVGSPASFIYESAGWGTFHADISEYAGDNVELRFHLDSDGSTQYAGVAIDDVRVSDLGGTLRNLTVAKNGTGTGTVTSAPAGINCGSDCIETLGENDQVTLSAASALGSSFTGWSGGGCTGTGQCVVTMDAHKTVTATFDEVTHELTVGTNGSGSGTVVSTPTGIDCGGDCLEAFGEGTQITLTATAESGSRFTGWTGSGCSGTGECVVTMDSAKNVAAAFGLIHDLTVSKNGTGTGLVTSNVAGINCGNDCTETYDEDAQITLTASPLTGSTFSGWSGAGCSGAGQCVVAMSGPQNPTATFTAIPRDLTVNKNGTGTGAVTSSPAGIDCGLDCQQTSNHGSQFTLTANPSVGSSFTGWSGAGCNGTGQCVVNMDADKTVTATFALARDLTVARDGTGSGSVSSTPTGISCGNDCSEAFAEGTQVTLTTTPTAGSTFGGWSGGGCSGTGQCIVDMSNNQDVTATFTAIPRNLTVSKNGTGSGSISSAPTGIDCGSDCQETLDHGTQITLTAGTSAGSSFAGWTGAGCSGTGQCIVTMDAAKSVTATFDDATPPSVPAMTALPDFHLNKQIPLSWSASTDSESGVSSYDLQQSTALPSKPFGTYLTVGSYSTTSTTYTGKAGSTYCFKARAVNGEGIASDYGSPEECTSMPLDDGSLKKTGKWETKKASGYYMGTYAKTTKKGVSAEVNVTAKHLALVATKCGSCGSVKVTLNGALLKKISLKSGGKTKMTVIELGSFATAKTGKLKIQTLSSKLVEIDGLGSSPF